MYHNEETARIYTLTSKPKPKGIGWINWDEVRERSPESLRPGSWPEPRRKRD